MVHLTYIVQIIQIIHCLCTTRFSIIIQHACLNYLFKLSGWCIPNTIVASLQSLIFFSSSQKNLFVKEKITCTTTNSRILLFLRFLGRPLQKLALKLGQRKEEGRNIFKVSLNHELSPVFSGNEWPLFFSPRCGNIVADVLDLPVSGKHLTFPLPFPANLSRFCTSKRSSKYV